MTRFLEADKKYQVNSNLIGVQVRPFSQEVVNGITVNYRYNIINVVSCVSESEKDGSYRPDPEGDYACFVVRGEDVENGQYYEIYFYDGQTRTDVNGVEYMGAKRPPYADKELWVLTTNQGDSLYDLNWDETLQGWVATGRDDVFWSDMIINELYCQVNTNQYTDMNSGIGSFVQALNPEMELFFDSKYGIRYTSGWNSGNKYFSKTNQIDVENNKTYYYWDGTGSGFPIYAPGKTGVGTNVSWENVNVGDTVVFRIVNENYNRMTVKSVDRETVVDPINCKVEYSVDGETWTAWPDNLTDENNVIANIPRYMYLKFGQDVEITEE